MQLYGEITCCPQSSSCYTYLSGFLTLEFEVRSGVKNNLDLHRHLVFILSGGKKSTVRAITECKHRVAVLRSGATEDFRSVRVHLLQLEGISVALKLCGEMGELKGCILFSHP